jgi:hypothetical protein
MDLIKFPCSSFSAYLNQHTLGPGHQESEPSPFSLDLVDIPSTTAILPQSNVSRVSIEDVVSPYKKGRTGIFSLLSHQEDNSVAPTPSDNKPNPHHHRQRRENRRREKSPQSTFSGECDEPERQAVPRSVTAPGSGILNEKHAKERSG